MLALKEQKEGQNCSSRMQTELTIERDLPTRSVTLDRASKLKPSGGGGLELSCPVSAHPVISCWCHPLAEPNKKPSVVAGHVQNVSLLNSG